MMKYFIIFLLIINAHMSFANYTVIKVHGDVVSLINETFVPVKVGDVFNNKRHFKTGEKSFVSIKTNKGLITLKEKTESTIEEMSDEKISLIHLLRGKIRSSIKKEEGESLKTIIRTKSVAIGVRGTDFITSFNDINLSTGVLGLEGQTDVLKILDDEIINDTTTGKSTLNEIESSTPLSISQGTFAQVFIGDSPIETYDVEPKQVELLSENSVSIKNKPSQGLVDLETNFFIPKDEKKEQIGSFDKKDGSYVPPEGLKLDPLQGFVNALKEKIEELKVLQAQLNSKIEDKIFQLKDLTSLGSKLETYYQYSNIGIEEHFERKRNIQKIDLHQFILKGDIHHLTFKNKKYEWKPRVYGELFLNNHQKNKMARNYDKASFGGASQFKRYFTLFDRRARFQSEISGGFIYKNLKAKGSLSYYASEASASTGLSLNYIGQKKVGLNLDLKFFETQESSTDVGHIMTAELFFDLFRNNSSKASLSSAYHNRQQFFKTEIVSLKLEGLNRDIFRKTDLRSHYEYRHQKDIELKIEEHFIGLSLERRKGPFLRYFISSEYGFLKTHESLNPIHFQAGVKGLF